MARPKSGELTARELAVMKVFWRTGEATAEAVREQLNQQGEQLAYVTVANVVRGLLDKNFLELTHRERPFRYRALRTFEDVSNRLVGNFLQQLFEGSREAMLVHVLKQKKLSPSERALLNEILQDEEGDDA